MVKPLAGKCEITLAGLGMESKALWFDGIVFPRGMGGDYPQELEIFENLGSNSQPTGHKFMCVRNPRDMPWNLRTIS